MVEKNKLKIICKDGISDSTEVYLNGELVNGLCSVDVDLEVGNAARIKLEFIAPEIEIEFEGIDYNIVDVICNSEEEEWYDVTEYGDTEHKFRSNLGNCKSEPFDIKGND